MAEELSQQPGYLKVSVDGLKDDVPLTFPLYGFFQKTKRLTLLKNAGQTLGASLIKQVASNPDIIPCCEKKYSAELQEYLKSNAPKQNQVPELTLEEAQANAQAIGDFALNAVEVMRSDESTEEKRKVLKKVSENVLSSVAKLKGTDDQINNEVLKACEKFASKVTDVAVENTGFSSTWNNTDWINDCKENDHETNVSTFVIIFALGIGYSEEMTLASLAFAAIIHDIGFDVLDPTIKNTPELNMDESILKEYKKHVLKSGGLIVKREIELPKFTLKIIEQHHENFDGTGYPHGLKGNAIDHVAQIFSVADRFDRMMKGEFDGKLRTPSEALGDLKIMQSVGMYPDFFNPVIFNKIVSFIEKSQNI
jgi:HD-GYP domain-containing protein (c-di-GMP phosphodiesterase class II)